MITCCHVFNVWPKTTLLLPVCSRDAKRWDILRSSSPKPGAQWLCEPVGSLTVSVLPFPCLESGRLKLPEKAELIDTLRGS